ncbi:unnamed protein product [Meloidogyne enterolobii]|uniref:Uncharacterized protein n=1 Tax=Meloidogyne enterolobii TaxID=390850 RepID=A0ACB0YVI8_MELEN
MENKNKFLQERVDDLTAREAEFGMEVIQIRTDFNRLRADFNELIEDVTEAKNKIYKWKKILIIIMFINCFIICFWVYRMFSH